MRHALRTLAAAALLAAPALAHAQLTPAQRRANAAQDARATVGYKLSMADVTTYVATMREIGHAIKADRALEQRFTSSIDDTIEQITTRLESTPQFRAAFARTGMTARRFAIVQYTYFGVAMALAMPGKSTPEQLAREMSIDPSNVAFVRTHGAQIQAMFEKAKAELGPAGDDDDEKSADAPRA